MLENFLQVFAHSNTKRISNKGSLKITVEGVDVEIVFLPKNRFYICFSVGKRIDDWIETEDRGLEHLSVNSIRKMVLAAIADSRM